jgi:hypothetical protein
MRSSTVVSEVRVQAGQGGPEAVQSIAAATGPGEIVALGHREVVRANGHRHQVGVRHPLGDDRVLQLRQQAGRV